MSTTEAMMLLRLLPQAIKDHPEWFAPDELAAAERLLGELRGQFCSQS